MRKFVIAILFVTILSGGYWYLSRQSAHDTTMPIVAATISDTTFRLHAPRTSEQNQTGLAAFRTLAADEGMVFRTLEPGLQRFWMKDMAYDIDILWVNKDNRIIHIVYSAARDSYPKTYSNPPGTESTYVIELPAGTCDKHGIAPGAIVTIKS